MCIKIRRDENSKKARCEFPQLNVILGAGNPQLAFKTLQQEINIGLLLHCNIIVYKIVSLADEPGKSVVAAIDARTMLSVVGANAILEAVSVEANENLKQSDWMTTR